MVQAFKKGRNLIMKILLVEDDEALGLGIEYSLRGEGFEVLRQKTLKDGIRVYDSEKIDFVLLDVGLPDGTGYELCNHIRKKAATPIIFLTACDDEVNVVMGLELGGDDYITKPFRIRELIARIRAVLRRHNISEDNGYNLKSEDVLLKMKDAKVYVRDEEISITPMDYKLLLYFMQNSGKVLTRGQLLNKLWDEGGEFVDDNTLSVYIKRLREKLENDSAKPQYILTVRGMGYKWDKAVSTL